MSSVVSCCIGVYLVCCVYSRCQNYKVAYANLQLQLFCFTFAFDLGKFVLFMFQLNVNWVAYHFTDICGSRNLGDLLYSIF